VAVDDNNNKYLLSGLKVIEIASMIMAPSCAAVLADYGAEVIKIEPPGKGDNNRFLHQLPGLPISEIPYSFQQDNRNKKAIVLDLKQAAGMSVLHDLLAEADILITNFRQIALQKLALEYEQLQHRYPRLIYAYATGFGERGAEANHAAYDMVSFWARSGLESSLYPIDGWIGPIPPGTGDHVSGMSLFAAISLALYAREKTGRGTKVSTSLLANGIWTNSTFVQAGLCGATFQAKRSHAEAYNALTSTYFTEEGELIKLTVVDAEKNWADFCRAIDREQLIQDARFATADVRANNMPTLIAIIDAALQSMPMEIALARLRQHDIPHSRVATIAHITDDAQLQSNDVLIPVAGENYRTVNSPIEVSAHPKQAPTRAPKYGEHSRQVLRDLGYDEPDIERLFNDRVVC
jgi:formyl-CoA transferase